MDETLNPADITETETETGVKREGRLDDGSHIKVEIIVEPEEL